MRKILFAWIFVLITTSLSIQANAKDERKKPLNVDGPFGTIFGAELQKNFLKKVTVPSKQCHSPSGESFFGFYIKINYCEAGGLRRAKTIARCGTVLLQTSTRIISFRKYFLLMLH